MNWLTKLANWWIGKKMPAGLAGGQWTGTSYADKYNRQRNPTPNELMAELKGTAWTCASLNASACASFVPRLYVTTQAGQAAPKCMTKAIKLKDHARLRDTPAYAPYCRKAMAIHEVIDHPLLDLLRMPTPANVSFGCYDLFELTTLYLEVHGRAFWYLEPGPIFGLPCAIWPVPPQNMVAKRESNSPNAIDYWSYRTGHTEERFSTTEIIYFRYPDPREPMTGGLSPLRAVYEQVTMTSHYAARKNAIFENDAVPAAVVSPDEVIGEEERDRFQSQWQASFSKGRAGKVVVAESPMRVNVLQHSLGDMAQLAEQGATKEMIANAFHVPIAFLTTNTNLANLQGATGQHMAQAISPRLQRRDEKLNESLVPLFDPSGRLFLASEDPIPVDASLGIAQMNADLTNGVVAVNEVRSERGLPEAAWGHVPWLNGRLVPTDVPRIFPGATEGPSPSINYGKQGQDGT